MKPSDPKQANPKKPAESESQAMASFGYRNVPADEKVKWVLRHFNSIAGKYDFMNTVLSLGLHHLWKKQSIQALALRAGDRVIDVCGGTADLSLLSAKASAPDGQVFLYDINRAMIEAGRPKVRGTPYQSQIRYVLGDAEQIAIRSGQLDAAVVGFGIRNLTRMEKGLAEMYRVLKPGGKVLCLEFSIPPFIPFRWLYDLYSFQVMPILGKMLTGSREAYTYLPESIRRFPLPEELAAILRGIGFEKVSYRSFTMGIAVAHFGTKPDLGHR